MSFAIIPQAQAENCSPVIYNGLLGPKFKKVGESNGETIYVCMRDDKPYPKITVNDSDIIAGGSQAMGMGNAQKVVDFGVSRVDVDGAVNHQQNIVDYLTNNAQKFLVNGEPATPSYKPIGYC
ncbi:hypothetical protein [Moraxella bovis]|uniref:Uncharacterized protein n=1 Tax=Moraxella bovis TaxID=476 RepID=A0A378PQC6_MORBO|nr:hypothetical protein [Moraxella bovis]STY90359.1 Uncharacterised protein [Moraxella bovis]